MHRAYQQLSNTHWHGATAMQVSIQPCGRLAVPTLYAPVLETLGDGLAACDLDPDLDLDTGWLSARRSSRQTDTAHHTTEP
jgi:hypothetical protein